jgi:PadR family transcriptional regulator
MLEVNRSRIDVTPPACVGPWPLARMLSDMLVLRALLFGPLHGNAIATHIQRTSEDVLRVDHGSLYPALYRLKKKGWITSGWERMPDRNREAKYYRLTPAGKKRLTSEHTKWLRVARAIGLVMEPVR